MIDLSYLRNIQPQGPADVDRSNPLNNDLVSLPLLSLEGFDPARQFKPTIDAGVTRTYSEYGKGLRGTTGADGFNLTAGTGFSSLVPVSSAYTVMMLMRVATLGTRRIFFADFNSGGTAASISMEQQATNIWRFVHIDGAERISTAGLSSTGWYWVEFAWDKANVQGRINGTLMSLSASATANRVAGVDLRVMRPGALASVGFNGDMAFLGIWKRYLPFAERDEIRARPWQLYRPIQRRIWVPVAGGGGTSQTVAFTLEDVSASVSQNLSHEQSLTGTLDDVTVSISQTAQHDQALSATLDDIAFAASQTVGNATNQALAITLDGVTVAASQTLSHSQSLDAALDGVTFAASQTLSHSQALAATLDGISVAINQSAAPSSKEQSLAVVLDGIQVAIAQEGPANLIDTHDGFWAKEWKRIRAREKRKYQAEVQERVEEIQDEIAEVEQQIAEVKQIAKPKKATPARDFYAEQARIVEHLIARRNQLIDEEDEELLLLL